MTKTMAFCLSANHWGAENGPTEDRALMAMAAQMLLHSVRHQHQVEHILATQEALRAVNQQLEALSMHDALTGLANRRHFDQVKSTNSSAPCATANPLSVLVCDIDRFKEYNGCTVTRKATIACAAWPGPWTPALCAAVTLARIGGEEFAVLLPGRARPARQVAERIREAVFPGSGA